jgi:hypothetical protein
MEEPQNIQEELTPVIQEEPPVIQEKILLEPMIIQNSDSLYKTNVKWIENIEYTPPNQFEIDMLKGTLTPEQLLEGEMTEEKQQLVKINDIKIKIKVVALNTMGESPIQNTSLFSSLKKKTLLDTMNTIYETVYMVDENKLTEMFNDVCRTKVFGDNHDYTSYPVYA